MHSVYNELVLTKFPTNIEILGECDLVCYDHSWQQLYNFLLPFKNFNFLPHQRLLILDHDTDYYPSENCVGNNMYNLIRLISDLNISTEHIVILTANYGLEVDVQILCDQLNLSYPKVIEFSQWYTFPTVSNLKEPHSSISDVTHLYICLNYKPRTHRMILMSLLYEKGLLSKGITSWHHRCDDNDSSVIAGGKKGRTVSNLSPRLNSGAHYRTTYPFTRINEDLNLCKKSAKLLSQNFNTTLAATHKNPLISGSPNDISSRWGADFFKNAFIFLVTETVGQYRHVYFSEKTWKAIASKKPFLLVGARGSLATLKKLGFKTFDALWDESYDDAETLFERADRITDILMQLSNHDWNDLAYHCQDIVQHNYKNLAKLQHRHLEQLQTI